MKELINYDDLLNQFTLQQRPYVTIADALDIIYRDFLASQNLTEQKVAPLDFTLLKRRDDGAESFRWILGYDCSKFKKILENRKIFKKYARLVGNNNSHKLKLDEYHKNVLENDKSDDIEFLTAVFHLTYCFNIPVAYNVGLVHKEHKKRFASLKENKLVKNTHYCARLCTEEEHDLAGLPPLQIENSKPRLQTSISCYEEEYRPYESFYTDWLYTIQGISLDKPIDYKYVYHLYFPIYDSAVPTLSTLRGYLGIFFSKKRFRDLGIEYFTERIHTIQSEISAAYKKGTLKSIVENYDASNPDPVEYWIQNLVHLYSWGEIELQDNSFSEDTEIFREENGSYFISIGRLLGRKVVSGFIDEELRNKYQNKILAKEIPPDILELEASSTSIYLRNRIVESVDLLDDLLQKRHILLNEEMVKKAASKSAVSAVMSRNMSHNLGSHVLAKLSTEKDVERRGKRNPNRKLAALNSFLRTRMDFLADLSTSTPTVATTLMFYRDIMAYFKPIYMDQGEISWQELLLDHISGVEGLKSQAIKIEFVKDGIDICLERPDVDPFFACPNGLLGSHALYIILENIIRNSAKHAYDSTGRKKLEIAFIISESTEYEEYLELCIYDKLGNANALSTSSDKKKPVVNFLNEKIDQSILDLQGKPRPEAWGILEMKICAAYLRKISPEELDEPHDPPLLNAVSIEGNLGYKMYVARPKEALIVDPENKMSGSLKLRRLLKIYGIEIFDERQFQQALTKNIEHEFLILVNPDKQLLRTIKENSKALPIRILTTSPSVAVYPHISLNELKFYLSSGADDIRKRVLAIWKKWLFSQFKTSKLFIRPEDNYIVDKWQISPVSHSSKDTGFIKHLDPKFQYIIYDRHGRIETGYKQALNEMIKSGNIIYYENVQQSEPTYFVINHASSKPELNRKTALELIEAGNIKIIILDERIQKIIEEVEEESHQIRDSLTNMKIIIPSKNIVDLDSPKRYCSQLREWLMDNLIETHFVIVHFGILQKLYEEDVQRIGKELAGWEAGFPNLNITIISGRGLPQELRPLRVRFTHYSQIARYLLEEKSKYHLCKILFASRRSI